AVQACGALGLPQLVLARPPWDCPAAIVVESDLEAAETVAQQSFQRIFLTTGRSGTAVFADSDAWFLIRAVTAPEVAQLPRYHHVVLSRGPYRYVDEYDLLSRYDIDVLVTKNSGGDMTRAKLDAAAALRIPIVMVARPPLPVGVRTAQTVDEAVEWVLRHCR
ncbi:MAG: precorrin-6A reductase, partial [Mycobacteriaceae bacterium]|nr:precorrin-6A reductase [Mycobacteriaceae bacterium]